MFRRANSAIVSRTSRVILLGTPFFRPLPAFGGSLRLTDFLDFGGIYLLTVLNRCISRNALLGIALRAALTVGENRL